MTVPESAGRLGPWKPCPAGDTILRELGEELGLDTTGAHSQELYASSGSRADHHIFVVHGLRGNISLGGSELIGIGFYLGSWLEDRLPMIPTEKMELHLQELPRYVHAIPAQAWQQNKIVVPQDYLSDSPIPEMVDWETQLREIGIRGPR